MKLAVQENNFGAQILAVLLKRRPRVTKKLENLKSFFNGSKWMESRIGILGRLTI